MSIFNSILNKIIALSPLAPLSDFFSKPSSVPQPQPSPLSPQANPTPSPTTSPNEKRVDVEAVLNGLSQKSTAKLNWHTSIVDLMKLLDLDSSLHARQELARELGYTGNMDDSAMMNIWLHKQVMRKLAENGGKVPKELRE